MEHCLDMAFNLRLGLDRKEREVTLQAPSVIFHPSVLEMCRGRDVVGKEVRAMRICSWLIAKRKVVLRTALGDQGESVIYLLSLPVASCVNTIYLGANFLCCIGSGLLPEEWSALDSVSLTPAPITVQILECVIHEKCPSSCNASQCPIQGGSQGCQAQWV